MPLDQSAIDAIDRVSRNARETKRRKSEGTDLSLYVHRSTNVERECTRA